MSSPYIHAALLLHFAKQPVNEENLKKVLSASGLTFDEARVKALVAAISEVNIDEALKSSPIGFAPASPAAAPMPAEAAAKPKEEKKKEVKEEKKKEEEALAGLGALFG
ncbi:MAG: 50S ribosomal protein P1 [Candidatus Bathyarchaeia archaeon]